MAALTKRVFVAVVMALAFFPQGASCQESGSLLLGAEYSDADFGFALRPPANWPMEKPEDGRAKAIFTGPVPPSPAPTVSVSVHEVATTFDDFLKDTQSGFLRGDSRPVIHSQLRCLIGGVHEAWRMELTSAEGESTQRRIVVAAEGVGKYYLAQFTCPEGSAGRFASVFDESAKSFRVSGPDPAQSAPQLAPTYADLVGGFSLNPPAGWAIDTSGKLGPNVIFVGPKRPDGTVPNIVVEVSADPRPFAEFMKAAQDALKTQGADFHLHAERVRYDGAGDPCDLLVEYSFTFNNVPLRSLKLLTDGEAGAKCTVTCTAPGAQFREYEHLFEAVCDTLRTFPPLQSYVAFRYEGDRYVNTKEKFSIVPPNGWTVEHGGAPGVSVRFLGQSAKGLRPEISVVSDANEAPLNAYSQAVREALRQSVPGIRINAMKLGKIGECETFEIDFSLEREGAWLRNLKRIVAGPGKKFIINCGAREDEFDGQKKLFEQCLQSFELR